MAMIVNTEILAFMGIVFGMNWLKVLIDIIQSKYFVV